MIALLTAASPARTVDVGFCASDGSGFFLEQPADHLERWNLPYDNGSHLVIDWRPDRRVCCLLYTSPSPRDKRQSRMPSSA